MLKWFRDKYDDWKGSLLVGSLKFMYLERLVLENNKVTYREKVAENIGRVRDVKVSPDGYIYLADRMKDMIVTGGENSSAAELLLECRLLYKIRFPSPG